MSERPFCFSCDEQGLHNRASSDGTCVCCGAPEAPGRSPDPVSGGQSFGLTAAGPVQSSPPALAAPATTTPQ